MAQPRVVHARHDTARELEEEVRALEHRLRQGEAVIREERARGHDPSRLTHWETRWIQLLRQYELLCDRLQRQMTAAATSDEFDAS